MQRRICFNFSEIIRNLFNLFDSQETCLIIINMENYLLLHILCGKVIYFIFQDCLININFNEQHLSNILIKFVNAFIKYKQF